MRVGRVSVLSKTCEYLPRNVRRQRTSTAARRRTGKENRGMRDLVYTGFMSLDGVVDSPGGGPGEEHRSGGWVVKDVEFLPEAFALKGEELAETTALMFGRRSYEAFAPTWRDSQDHAAYRDLPKYVVSSTISEDALVDGWGQTTTCWSSRCCSVPARACSATPTATGRGCGCASRRATRTAS